MSVPVFSSAVHGWFGPSFAPGLSSGAAPPPPVQSTPALQNAGSITSGAMSPKETTATTSGSGPSSAPMEANVTGAAKSSSAQKTLLGD